MMVKKSEMHYLLILVNRIGIAIIQCTGMH